VKVYDYRRAVAPPRKTTPELRALRVVLQQLALRHRTPSAANDDVNHVRSMWYSWKILQLPQKTENSSMRPSDNERNTMIFQYQVFISIAFALKRQSSLCWGRSKREVVIGRSRFRAFLLSHLSHKKEKLDTITSTLCSFKFEF
jgi:hypothetical protein